MGSRKPVVAAALAILALAAVPAAFGAPPGGTGIGPPRTATPSGQELNQLYWFVFAVCAVVFVLVETVLILFIVRFRRRRTTPVEAEGPQIHGNTRLELIWTGIPVVVLAAIAIVVFVRTPDVQATPQEGDPDELVVQVEGHQFYWRYVYPDGEIALDTLVVPVDTPVRLELTSYDVNHSWWVPELTGKRDAIPGRTNVLRFRPLEEGVYDGECAELCGILHAVMPTTVEVVSEAEYADRLGLLGRQDQPGATQLALGRDSWDLVCAKCHGPAGEGDIAPAVAQNGALVDEEQLRELLYEGFDRPETPEYMPPVGRNWEDFHIRALIEYVRSNERLAPAQAQDAEGNG
ncbi:MAG TPA: cytochrome c oxidase subunit II [Gaiellaceae bacterium]|nr:cytochrome c oxidase subunit II [Gaiellaceae bacterium]